uniref:Putative serine/threonine-protein kinase-like protein CCR3 n=1 Tax=Aegilops tauschii TaxID=37682 RepID=M8AZN2_AEGTA
MEDAPVCVQVSSISSDNPRALTWSEIAASTSFAVELGRGRSGRVYKGRLQFHFHHGTEVAVKVLEKHGRQSVEDAFVAESNILSGLRHDNIVRLVGWCTEKEYRTLVYQHMGKCTLREHLQHFGGGPSSSPVTTSWEPRVEVLLGVVPRRGSGGHPSQRQLVQHPPRRKLHAAPVRLRLSGVSRGGQGALRGARAHVGVRRPGVHGHGAREPGE